MITLRTRTNPTIKNFFDVFDELFETIIYENNTIGYPLHNTIENESEYILELQLAGIKKENVSIDAEKNKLVVKAERIENKDLNYLRKEISCGRYEKLFTLPDFVDKENIKASFIDGILTINIPKIVDEKILSRKKIEIT
jgi:HSP20 family protein